MNILLSSVGRRSYLVKYFKKVLDGRGQVIATNTIADTTGMLAADKAIVVPCANSPEFIDNLLHICKENNVRLLCSLHDWEAIYIAPHKNLFAAEGVIVLVPEPSVLEACLDKYKSAHFAESIDIVSPKCFIDISSALKAISDKVVHYPLILKPRWGQGSIHMIRVSRKTELINAYELIHSKLKDEGLSYLAGSEIESQILIQQYIDGSEYGVDIVNDLDGQFVACFVKQKLAMRSGETDKAITAYKPKIEKYAKLIAKATRHPGIMDADFLESKDGRIYLLELNPRFGGGYPFTHAAGANIPAALISWVQDESPKEEWLKYVFGIKSIKDINTILA